MATDGWKDISNGKRLNTVSCCIEGTKFERSTSVTGEIQDQHLMVAELKKVVRSIGEEKVVLVLADGAGNMKAALNRLEREYPRIYTLRCMAHLCQLLFKV